MLTEQKWVSSSLTNTGNIRQKNEDAFLVNDHENFWLVADGMGGHASGEIASRKITEKMQAFCATPLLGQNVRNIVNILKSVNLELEEYARTHDLGLVGSTVAILHIHKNVCICVWAGDSRVYRLRRKKLVQLTTDHCQLTEYMEEEYDAEQIQFMAGSSAITRAIGSDEILAPQVNIFDLHSNDKFLLCSDGLNKELSDNRICEILSSNTSESANRIMLQQALDVKGRDNITIVTIEPDIS